MGFETGNRDWTQAFDDVYDERKRQDAKWGRQDHPPAVWMAILGEEFGEACRDALALTFCSEKHGGGANPLDRLRDELVQVAAVAVAAVECIDRGRARSVTER